MKKILMISYYFPPLADVGGLRALGFSKYLRDFGWEPYVLSVRNPDKAWCTPGNAKPPAGIETYYTQSLINLTWAAGKLNGLLSRLLAIFGIRLSKPIVRDLLCIPDQFVGWIPLTFLKGLSLIRKYDIDLIYVSSKPFSSAIIGALLKVATKRPLILDFRDPVSPLFFNINEKYYECLPSFKLRRKMEEVLLRYADRFIVVTEQMEKRYLQIYPFLEKKVELIYNGFMQEYFSRDVECFDKFTIVYTGNFYAQLMSPEPFFDALEKVITKEKFSEGDIQFLYVGEKEDWLIKVIDKYNLHKIVKMTGQVDREISIESILRASILLIRIVDGALGTKIFEGLAAGVPILLLTNEIEGEEMIRKYSKTLHHFIRPDDVDGITGAIKDAYEKWQNKGLEIRRNPAFYEEFNKRRLTSKFAEVLNEALHENCEKV
jgi:glycosyltransferase involved in cell wall biosynthesis